MLLGLSGTSTLLLYRNQSQAEAINPPVVLGLLPYQKIVQYKLSDTANLAVNAANGNVIMQTQDMAISGTGPALNITRYFNDLGTGNGQAGSHTTLSVGADVHLTANSGGSVTYQGPSGFKVNFAPNGSGGYTTPAEYTEAKLASVSGGGWTLTFNKTKEVFTFNTAGNQVKHQNATGQFIAYAYNANNTLASATDTQGRVVTFTNYNGTKVGKITDPSGRSVTYGYTNDQLTSVTDINGGLWQMQYYDTRGNINQITDPRGYTTTLTYDGINRISSIKFNDYTSAVVTYGYGYDNTNAKTVFTDPLNHQTNYFYDAQGRVTSVQDATGASYGATYDANNNQLSKISPSNYSTTATYDSLNNLKTFQNPTLASGQPGVKTQYAYTNAAQPYLASSSTDGQGNQTAYSYNTAGQLTAKTGTSSGGTGTGTITYKLQGDPNGSGGTINCSAKIGQACQLIDANGNVTSYAYDTQGNVLSIVLPGPVGSKAYTYDSLSRVKTYTDGKGSKVTYNYDTFGRVKDATYASDNSVINYTYDANGNMTRRNDAGGERVWVYDGYNRVTKITQTGQADLSYTYDTAGNLKTEQGPAGTITYNYDAANQIAGINQSVGNANQTYTFTDGRPTSISLPGGITQTLTYDRAGRQTSIKAMKGSTVLTDYTATYAKSSGTDTELMQTETDNVAGITTTYGYDGLNRLTSATGSGTGSHSYTYAYDANGNRTQYSKDGNYSAIFGFNAANQLTTAGSSQYGSYDQAGNQTSTSTGMSMAYNPKNQMTYIAPTASTGMNLSYLDAGQTERGSIGNVTQQNGLLGLYGDTASNVATYYTRLPGADGQPLGQTVSTSNYYYLTDLHGSVVRVTDANGNVKNSYSYDPFGNSLSSSSTVTSPYRYASGYYDSATSLYKFGARYYNPVDARWTQTDPSGRDFGYLYSINNPVNFSDPTGYSALSDALYVASELANIVSAYRDGAAVGFVAGAGIGCAAGAFFANAPGCVAVGFATGTRIGVQLGALNALNYVLRGENVFDTGAPGI